MKRIKTNEIRSRAGRKLSLNKYVLFRKTFAVQLKLTQYYFQMILDTVFPLDDSPDVCFFFRPKFFHLKRNFLIVKNFGVFIVYNLFIIFLYFFSLQHAVSNLQKFTSFKHFYQTTYNTHLDTCNTISSHTHSLTPT